MYSEWMASEALHGNPGEIPGNRNTHDTGVQVPVPTDA